MIPDHTNYALFIVLEALLLASGIGSLVSQTIVLRLGNVRFVSYVVAFLVPASQTFVLPYSAHRFGARRFPSDRP